MAQAPWTLVRAQHGVVSRRQLLALGVGRMAIEHRIAHGRLHPVFRGVYAVGRPDLTQRGRWMAAVLSCGGGAVLSHEAAAALWEIRHDRGQIEVSVPVQTTRLRPGVVVHRRKMLAATTRLRIPVTTLVQTFVDLATRLACDPLEAAINEADKRNLIDPETLRAALGDFSGQPGVRVLRGILDRHTFRETRSRLERRFLPIVRKAGLPLPQTQVRLNGFDVDFYWADLGLVVETDGLTYHRTPATQARDRLRDQTHAAAGLMPLRFTQAQVRYDPEHVRTTLVAVAKAR